MSFGEYFNAFSSLGGAYQAAQDRNEQKAMLSKLGDQIQVNDYTGAAGTALRAGDLQAGLGLLKILDTQQQRKLTADADADFARGFGGFGVGGAAGIPAGAPAGSSDGTTGAVAPGKAFQTSDPVADDLAPHQKALLNAIAVGESGGKYNVRFTPQGGATFSDLSQHPNVASMGPDGPSTAAGRYQFIKGTWDGVSGGTDFSPANQDRAALKLAQQDYKTRTGRDLDTDLQRTGFTPQIAQVLAPTWTSFRGNGANRATAVFANSLSRYAGAGAPQVASADPSFAPQMPTALGTPARMPQQAPVSGLNPGRPVQFADDEAQTQALESRMGMYPRDVYGIVPQGGAPAQSQASRPIASPDPQSDMPTPDAQPAQFRIPPGPQQAPGSVAALPAGISSPQPRGPLQPPAMPPQPAPTLPPPGGAPGRVMATPGDGSAPVAQAAPQIPPDARIGNAPAAAIAQSPLGQRIPYLMRAIANPNLSEGPRQIAQTLLKQALDETAAPPAVREYLYARANGYTQAQTPADYAREKAQQEKSAALTGEVDARSAAAQRFGLQPGTPDFQNYVLSYKPEKDKGADLTAETNARQAAAVRFGLQPGTPEFRSYVLTGKEPTDRDEGAKITSQIDARRRAAPDLGLQEGSPSWRSFVATGKVGADRDMSAGDKKAIDAADNAVLSAQSSISLLEQAKKLSAEAYGGPLAKARGDLMSAIGGERGQATQELDNLVTTNALTNLKSIFGGNPTEGERKILLDVAGSSSLPHALRVKVYQRAIDAAQLRMQQNLDRGNQIREGTYYRAGSGPAAAQGAAPSGQSGAPALPAPSPLNRPGAMPPAARFQQLIGSGMSKTDAYQQLHSEGY